MERLLYPSGIPRWFTRLHHRHQVRRCRRIGHQAPAAWFPLVVNCGHCGQVFEPGQPRRVLDRP